MDAGHFRSEHIFEFVREFAEFVETASRGITLQRVDHAANPANHFLIRGTSLELQAGFIERLQQLCGALKEERAQLAVAIVGVTAHVFASIR